MPGLGQPRKVHTELTFVVKTCRKVTEENYKLDIKNLVTTKSPSVTQVTLLYAGGVFADCFGPVHETEIRLETKEILPYSSIVLLNPLLRSTSYVH